ncbi:MAG: phosphoadenosine phosphosulfate reductase family protein [Pseudomonadota bacterium]
MKNIFQRHERIAFQFSGGRDSTVALYLLREHWARMRVYHVDTGEQFPETRSVVEQVGLDVPIIRIESNVAALREQHGLPSDLLPVDNTPFGQMVSGRPVRLSSRYDCCARALMWPMHHRMVQDGITAIVRGQRDDEYAVQPLRSGDVADGFEFYYPVQHWTGEQVSQYLADNGLPVAPFYASGLKRAPECMGCTAWWDEGRLGYLAKHHPDQLNGVMGNIFVIREEIFRQGRMLGMDVNKALSAATALE